MTSGPLSTTNPINLYTFMRLPLCVVPAVYQVGGPQYVMIAMPGGREGAEGAGYVAFALLEASSPG